MPDFRKIIENARTAALILRDGIGEGAFLAREALHETLVQRQLSSYFFPHNPEDFKNKWKTVISAEEPSVPNYHSLIRINKNAFDVKEAGYEKTDDSFVFDVFSVKGHLAPEDVIVQAEPIAVDATFFFGKQSEEASPELVKTDNFFVLGAKKKTITEDVFGIIEEIKRIPLAETKIPTLLLASLLAETQNLKEKTSAETFSLANSLVDLGADKRLVKEITIKRRNPAYSQLLGRALARARINEETQSVWFFLSQDDLEKTDNLNAEISLFKQLLVSAKDLTPFQPVYVLLWRDDAGVFCLATSVPSREKTISEAAKLLGAEKTEGFLFSGPYANFSEAELKTKEVLKKTT